MNHRPVQMQTPSNNSFSLPSAKKPWYKRITRWDVLCIGPIILFLIYSYAMTPFAYSLTGKYPLLLEALRGHTYEMIVSGAHARVGDYSIWLALVAPIFVLMITDPFLYWAGRRYGRTFLHRISKSSAANRYQLEKGEKFFKKYGFWTIVFAYIIPAPTLLFYLAAGETRMKFRTFILADLAGTMMWISINVFAGYFIGQPAVDFANRISSYGFWVTLGVVILISVFSTVRANQKNKKYDAKTGGV